MPRRAVHKDFATTTVSNGGVSVSPSAISIPVLSVADFPTQFPFTIRSVSTGEVMRAKGRHG